MTTTFNPTYFDVSSSDSSIRLTNEVTKKPVPESNPFYQEQQSGGKCAVHSMDAFAGTKAVDINELFKLNTDIFKKTFADMLDQGISDIDVLKNCNVYLGTLADLDKNGVDIRVIKSYLDTYKDKFDLPSDGSINVTQGLLSSQEIQNEINRTQTNPSLHRVILGIGGTHFLTIRKDKKNRWRVIDSQIVSHTSGAEKVKRVQPRFETLQKAIEHVSIRYTNNYFTLISPTKEKTSSKKGWYIGMGLVALGCAALYYCMPKPAK